MNLSSVVRDEMVFEEPEKFKPERYLTGDIAFKKQRTAAFGFGKHTFQMQILVFVINLSKQN